MILLSILTSGSRWPCFPHHIGFTSTTITNRLISSSKENLRTILHKAVLLNGEAHIASRRVWITSKKRGGSRSEMKNKDTLLYVSFSETYLTPSDIDQLETWVIKTNKHPTVSHHSSFLILFKIPHNIHEIGMGVWISQVYGKPETVNFISKLTPLFATSTILKLNLASSGCDMTWSILSFVYCCHPASGWLLIIYQYTNGSCR